MRRLGLWISQMRGSFRRLENGVRTFYGWINSWSCPGLGLGPLWADVTPSVSSTVTVEVAVSKQGEPSVKYRGLFINDEENFTAWSAAKMDAGKKVGPETYKRVFELLLRLKANFLWPAMHAASDEFNKYPENAQNAQAYGIVMGSSHVEMMLRNNTKEWSPWASSHRSGGYGVSTSITTLLGGMLMLTDFPQTA